MSRINTISIERARDFLVGHHGLRRSAAGRIPDLLRRRRCIQLDPLDRIGSNADLVVAARLDGTSRGDVYEALFPGEAFEHYFKERCLLPPSSFPHYRRELNRTGWWSYASLCDRPSDEILADVVAEIRTRGPLLPRQLEERGMAVSRKDHPWARKTTMNTIAVDVLQSVCDLVVVGRTGQGKRYDLPERALGPVADAVPEGSWGDFVVRERVEAAGLLPLNAGPWWSLAKAVRTDRQHHAVAEVVQVAGLERKYLAPKGFLDRTYPEDDGRMRVIGPLDPLIWDRALVQHVWDFEYVWEVYKPAAKRRWGYYVCPLLHEGRLVGRFEARRDGTGVVVDNLWPEAGATIDEAAFAATIERLAASQ